MVVFEVVKDGLVHQEYIHLIHLPVISYEGYHLLYNVIWKQVLM